MLVSVLSCHSQSVLADSATTQEARVQTSPFSYSVTPVPANVVSATIPLGTTSKPGGTGLRYLLVDRQISLLEERPRNFARLIVQPLDAQAVQKAAQLYVYFNPEYQKLELHSVRITRNGQTMDRTQQAKFELLQRETRLEQQQYDGEVSAVAILADIRVNDIIEFERSVVGENPIFKGRFAAMSPMRAPATSEHYSLRLVHPEGRTLNLRAPSFARETRESRAGVITRTLQAQNLKAYTDDTDRPNWFDPQDWVEISEYRDWRDVGQWADGLFLFKGQLAPDLLRQIEIWRTSKQPREQLVAEVLRWVQREIRYFGIELGVNSHLPHHPNVTYERRFGDCKDKSLLLAAILRELGVDARPALVSMARQRTAARLLPSPLAFDHAIVRVDIDGSVYWLDPALPVQYGSLNRKAAFDYGKALVTGAASEELVTVNLPTGYANTYELLERYEISDFKQPSELVSELVVGQSAADYFRSLRAKLPKEEFDRILHSDYLRLLPTAQAIGEVEVRDDQAENRLTLVRRYRIPELFEYSQGRFQFGASSPLALDILRGPEVPRRSTPYELPYPLDARISQVLVLPNNPIRDIPPPSVERTPYFSLKSTFKRGELELRRDLQITVLKDSVPADAMLGYIESIQNLRQKSGVSLSLRVGMLSDADRQAINQQLQRFKRLGKSNSGALNVQIEAEVGIRQNTLDIESGKLSNRNLARAHANRAIQYDELEQNENALRDIDKAIEYDPSQVEYRLSKARILSGDGRFAESLSLFEALEQQGYSDDIKSRDWGALGRDLLYLGRYAEADRAFERAINAADPVGGLIQAYWQHIAARRSGGAISSRLAEHMATQPGPDWPAAVGQMLLGRLSDSELLLAAKHDDKGIERDQLAEAHFYLAQKALFEGNKDDAGKNLDACLELGVTPFMEHGLARIELKEFGERPKGFAKWLKSL